MSSASFSQSAAGALYFPPGSELPPASTEPRWYLRTSSGVVLPMSPWITWPTFCSTDMRATSACTRASSAASRGSGDATIGQLAGLAMEVAAGAGAVGGGGTSSVLQAGSNEASRMARGTGFITGMEVRMRCPRWRTVWTGCPQGACRKAGWCGAS